MALRRTHGLLQSELSRSRFATETLNASTAALHDLSTRYTAFDDIVSSSRELIIDLIRKNKSDRWYYEKAVQLLIGILVWILVRRLLWGPVWLFVGLPFKFIWWTLSLVASTIGVGGDGGILEIREGSEGIERVVGTATVEVKGIPDRMMERMPTQSVAVEESGITKKSMKEKVERIIDGKEDVIMMEEAEVNPKSRRVENDSVEEQIAQAGDRNPKSMRMEYDSQEGQTVQTVQIERGESVIQGEQIVQEGNRNPKSRRMEYDLQDEQMVQREQMVRGEPVMQEEQTTQEGDRNPKSRRMEYDSQDVQREPMVRGESVMQGEQVFQEEDRNPKSRRMDYNPAEESSVQGELHVPIVDLTADTREPVEEMAHDEL